MNRLLGAPLLAAIIAACSSSSSGALTAEQAATDAAQAYCARLNGCAPFLVQVAYGDTPTCATRLKIQILASLKAPSTATTPAQVESCGQAIASTSCDDAFARQLPDACKSQAGALANGAACGDDSQCQSKYCNKSGNACGACGTRAQPGGNCTVDDDCDYGQACTNRVCVKPGRAGDPCDANRPCLVTYVCKSGTCGAPAGTGAACTQPFPGNDCDQTKGLFCNGQTNVCAQIGTAGAGASCGFVNNGLVACTGSGSNCKGATLTAPGTCQAAAADGASCDAVNGPNCMSPAMCTGGVCKLPDATACK